MCVGLEIEGFEIRTNSINGHLIGISIYNENTTIETIKYKYLRT